MAKKILIVDDEIDLLRVTAFRLKNFGYDVLTAANGQEALELIEKDQPDLILLDLRIPLISGYEVCKKIKSDNKLKAIPVIIFTASAVGDLTEKMLDIGADDFIVKPFEPQELLEKIKKLIPDI